MSLRPPQANYVKHTSIKDLTIDGKLVKVIQKTKFMREVSVALGYEYLHQSGDTISYWKDGDFINFNNFSSVKRRLHAHLFQSTIMIVHIFLSAGFFALST